MYSYRLIWTIVLYKLGFCSLNMFGCVYKSNYMKQQEGNTVSARISYVVTTSACNCDQLLAIHMSDDNQLTIM